MATKLASTLRKSISAEKETVEKKVTPRKKTAKVSESVQIKKPATQDVVQPSTEAENKSTQHNSTVSHVEQLTQNTFHKFDINSLTNFNPTQISSALNTMNTSTQQLINSAMEAVQAINQDVANYLYEIVDPKNLANASAINTEFFTKIRLRQEAFWQTNIELFNQLFKIK